MKHETHVKKVESESKMNEWLARVRHSRVSLSIYKYGNEMVTKDQFAEFNVTCIVPQNQDCSGAPNEAIIQAFIPKLYAKWDNTWEDEHPIWVS
ncbi:hypothetical protein B5M09_011949 [Aphanomyces astaci]|uniref:Uncharacterized protein n=1 Tax=Aphanomyces astaci TaxID=112090 RepID=A0A3R7WQX6_APHAT|nr:hypothetical protein B5M09_011949 [Aphanomyces astaci]